MFSLQLSSCPSWGSTSTQSLSLCATMPPGPLARSPCKWVRKQVVVLTVAAFWFAHWKQVLSIWIWWNTQLIDTKWNILFLYFWSSYGTAHVALDGAIECLQSWFCRVTCVRNRTAFLKNIISFYVNGDKCFTPLWLGLSPLRKSNGPKKYNLHLRKPVLLRPMSDHKVMVHILIVILMFV